MTRWADLDALWLLVVVPLLGVAYAVDAAERRRLLAQIGDARLVTRLAASSSRARRVASAAIVLVALALLIVALARPQYGGAARLVKKRGGDLVVALDFSKSMLARDVEPSRIERAKIELDRLLDSLGGDRVGLVGFAGETVRYPLTTDYAAAKLFWRDLDPTDMPVGGTAIAKAIRAAVDLLEGADRNAAPRARAIVLLTDGEDTVGDPLDAARKAAMRGIRIFTVGVGSASGELIPQIDEEGRRVGWQQESDGRYVMSRLDEATLRAIAETTGGEYFAAGGGGLGVERVARALDKAQKAEHEARLVRLHEEAYAFFLFPAFLLLVVDTCLGDRKRGA